MRVHVIRIVAAALLASVLLSSVACAKPNEQPTNDETTSPTEGVDSIVATEAVTAYMPNIEKKNYDCEFNLITPGFNADLIYLSKEDSTGDSLDSAIYERGVKIQDQLGVTLVWLDAGDWIAYSGNVIRTVQAGDDDYQLVYTPVYQGVCDLVTSNVLYDFQNFDAVNLNASYWRGDLMEDIAISDQYLLGYNDTCLSLVKCIVFNKDMLEANQLESPYDLVRNKTWTLDKFIEMGSGIYIDNGDGKRGPEDTYGITGWGWVPLISFVTSSDLKIVDRNAEGDYVIAYEHNRERMLSLIDKMFALYNAESSWMWFDKDQVDFSAGTSLFQLYSSDQLVNFRDKDLRFGILPYPLWDEQQEEYKTLNWNGLMAVPSTIQNPDMVGEVLELMAYHTSPVKDAYYENLLSAKLADAPDDVEMLNIIWDSQVSDIGVHTANDSTTMDQMVYMIPLMCQDGNNTFASYMRGKAVRAQQALDKVFKQG